MICRLDSGYIDLYFIHSSAEGHVLELYKAVMMMCNCRLDRGCTDLYLVHSPAEGHGLESYKP